MSEVPDPEVVELATKVFDLARRGETETLAAYVDAGVPAEPDQRPGRFAADARRLSRARRGGHRPRSAVAPTRTGPTTAARRPLAGAVFKGEDAVIRALLAAVPTRRPEHRPRVDTARMFGKADLLELFGSR